MDFHGVNINIEEVIPTMGGESFEVNFTIGDEWFQFMYYPDNPSNDYFSDLPEEFEPYTSTYTPSGIKSIEEEFTKLVKHYLIVRGLKGDAKDTWSDILS
jgi:hypothetical protein